MQKKNAIKEMRGAS